MDHGWVRHLLATLAMVSIHGSYCTTVQAGEIVVATTSGAVGGPDCTLRNAITAANSDLPTGSCPAGSGADTIVLAPGATYSLDTVDNTTVEDGNVQPNGLPDITSAITITGNGATIARLTTGTPSFRLLHVAAAGHLTVTGLTLTGGLAPADVNADETVFSGGNGGAIFNEGSLTLTQTHVTNNQAAASGGGIYNTAGATLNLTDSVVSGNQSDACSAAIGVCPGIGYAGGGLTNDGTVTASRTLFNGNGGNAAGAIYNTGSLSLDGCTVSGNEVDSDVGGLDNLGSASITDSTFFQNVADNEVAGAIQNESSGTLRMTNCVLAENGAPEIGAILNYGTATLTNCTVRNNGDAALANDGTMILAGCTITDNSSSSSGGGIANGGTMELTDCTVSGNLAGDGDGGGIGNSGTLTITNCTISGNMSLYGVGAGVANEYGGTVTINNSIITDNIVTGNGYVGPQNCYGPILGTGHNLSTDDTCGSVPDFIVADAGVAPLGNYGGPTETMALCTAVGVPAASCTGPSPAIDAGDPDVCAAPPVNGLDQRGFARPGIGQTRCSLGAFEADAVPAHACIGDCRGTATVAVSDLVTLVNIALGTAPPSACRYGVPGGTDVSVALLIQAVNNALSGCPLG